MSGVSDARPGRLGKSERKGTTMNATEQLEICGKYIQYDRSGVGNCWTNATSDDVPANIVEEIAAEMIDGDCDECSDFRASNGVHYRW